MNESTNLFEVAVTANSSGANPFETSVVTPDSNLFSSILSTSQMALATVSPNNPPIDLGSQTASENPFDGTITAQNPPAVNTTSPVTPIALGSQPIIPITFVGENAETLDTSTKKESAPQLMMLPGMLSGSENNNDEESDAIGSVENPLGAALGDQGSAGLMSIFTKPPVFEHGTVKEPIEDLNQTFEDLRAAKADDFPELEDDRRVTWDVIYGKIRKTVPTPKKTKIGEFKKSIEKSKEFLDALKKDKNKSPDCIIKPRVTAQSKGQRAAGLNDRCGGDVVQLPSYKGVFTHIEEAETSGKVIRIVPGSDGKVYEIRKEEAGTFITPSGACKELSEIQAGFTPALPLVPHDELRSVIGFFRSFMSESGNFEAIANILWDRERQEYLTVIPKQHVTAVRADSELSDEYDPERYLHYMDIHSHNVMPAKFSARDDADEKATRLYAVIGRLNNYIPEISVRISNGGKYLLIDPAVVFESFGGYYPVEWNEQVTLDVRDGNTYMSENSYQTPYDRFISTLKEVF